MRGVLIAIEGIDGAGSTTQARLLAQWLKRRGLSVVLTKEPTKGEVGRLIRRRLKKRVVSPWVDALLFAADRAMHVQEVILPALKQGLIVVTDRYVESSIAYQVAEGAELEWIEAINSFAPKPDLTIILDLPPRQALARKTGPREGFEEEGFLSKVRELYLTRAREKNYFVVNADRALEEVHVDVRRVVEGFLKSQRLRGR